VKRPSAQTVGTVAVLAALAALAVVTAPAQPPLRDTYASTAYDATGYRAWSALLEREGIATERFVLRPIELDAHLDTLISAQPPAVAADPQARTAADVGALAAWVRGGGRLVYAGRFPNLGDAERRLLKLPIVMPDVGGAGAPSGPLTDRVTRLRGLGADRMLLVEHAGSALLSDRNGDIVVRYPLGRGSVIAVSDPQLFANANIARADNARLAYLVGRPQHGGTVAFDDGVHGSLVDRPWYRALPIPVRVGLGIGAVALLFALVGSALSGVPPMRLDAPREPGSEEFIDALAALYERTGARAAVRAILVRDALAAAARRAGLADETPPDVVVARLADRGADTATLRRLAAARDTPVATDAALLASAQLAYLVRKDLTHGGNGDRRRATLAGWTRARRRR
jgi:hypothetical protein